MLLRTGVIQRDFIVVMSPMNTRIIDRTVQENTQRFAGEVTSQNTETGMLKIEVKNKLTIGDQVELMLPEGNHQFILDYMEDKNGKPIDIAPGSGYQV